MKRSWLYSLFACALAAQSFFGGVPVAHAAATWTVESLADGPADAAHCPGASCTLRDALAAAGPGETINFAVTGTITLNQAQHFVIDHSLTITGPGYSLLTIDANHGSRIFIVYSGAIATISGLTLTGGWIDDLNTSSGSRGGGAILNVGDLTLDQVTIDHNHVFCVAPCALSGDNNRGGGIASSSGSSLTITNSFISNNTTTGFGGGLSFSDTAAVGNDLVLNGVKISANYADIYGGGLSLTGGNSATLTKVVVSNNTTLGEGGGLAMMTMPVTITQSTFDANIASTWGGGITAWHSAGNPTVLTVGSSTFSNNSSSQGGGGLRISSSTATIYNTTLDWNVANGDTTGGGGLLSGYTALSLYNDTFADNEAGSGNGGGLDVVGGTVSVTNTIISGSTGTDCRSDVAWSANLNNLIRTSDYSHPCPAPASTADPLLASLGFHGGPVKTRPLTSGSPAIDAGDDAACADPSPVGGADARGVARAHGPHCDMGAYERITPWFHSDFGHDHMSDPAKWIALDGTVWWLRSSNGTWNGRYVGTDATSYVPRSDFDGDGKTDPAKWIAGSGMIWYRGSMDATWHAVSMGADVSALLFGMDFDGDGRTDPTKYIDSGYIWYLASTAGDWKGIYIGTDGVPLWGCDFDGDGKTDPAKYVPAGGAIWYFKSTTNTWEGVYIGTDGNPITASDFDGDGETDAAKLLASGDTLWYLASSTNTWHGLYLGPGVYDYLAGHDFDGDGKTDPATFNSSSGSVWYRQSSNGTWQGKWLGADAVVSAN